MRKGTIGIASLAIAGGLVLAAGAACAAETGAPSVSWPNVLPPPSGSTNAAPEAQQRGPGIGLSQSGITTGAEAPSTPRPNLEPSNSSGTDTLEAGDAAAAPAHKKRTASHHAKAAHSSGHAPAPPVNQKARVETDQASEQLRAEQAERVKVQSAKASAPAANTKVQSSPGAATD